MKKEIYCSVMKKVKMSDECVGNILDAIEENASAPQEKKVRHIKLVPLLTAAVVLICCSITVAAEMGGFDWIKKFYYNDDFVISQDIMDMAGDMEDFKCTSEIDAELSPLGVIATNQDLYCLFKVDNIAEGYSSKGFAFCNIYINGDEPMSLENSSISDEDGVVGFPISCDKDVFHDGDKIKIVFGIYDNEFVKESEKLNRYVFMAEADLPKTEIEFTLNFGDVYNLNIDYSKYTCDSIPQRNYDFLFDTVSISPLSIYTHGDKEFYADAMLQDGMTIKFEDGTSMKCELGSMTSSYENWHEYQNSYNTTWAERVPLKYELSARFNVEKPINPEKVKEIYLGEMKIYEKS